MYQKGEYILLKSGGIWEVMQSHTQQFHLRNLKTNWKKTLPANSTEIVRKICDKNIITEAIERVGFIRTIQQICLFEKAGLPPLPLGRELWSHGKRIFSRRNLYPFKHSIRKRGTIYHTSRFQ